MNQEELIKRLEEELNKRKDQFAYYHNYEPIDEFGSMVMMEVVTVERTLEWVLKLVKGEDPGRRLLTYDWAK